jgi:hypothetical protein
MVSIAGGPDIFSYERSAQISGRIWDNPIDLSGIFSERFFEKKEMDAGQKNFCTDILYFVIFLVVYRSFVF